MSALRTGVFVVLATTVLYACTFTRSLDYLTDGPNGADSSSSSSGGQTDGSSSSSSSSSGLVPAGAVLASNQANPAHLAADADNLYWTTDENRIMKIPKAGGTPQELAKLAGSLDAVVGLAVDPTPTGNVFVLMATGTKTVPKAGGAPTDFLVETTGLFIAADDTFVFVLHQLGDDTLTSVLTRYPKANPAQPTNLSPAGETAPTALRLFGDAVLWAATNTAAELVLNELPKTAAAGTAPTIHKNTAKDQGSPIEITPIDSIELAVDADAIYWIDSSLTLRPYRLPRTPPVGAGAAILNAKNAAPVAIAVDAKSIYVTDASEGAPSIARIPKDGSVPQTLVAQPGPSDVLADDKAIYVVFAGPGGVGAHGGIQRIPAN